MTIYFTSYNANALYRKFKTNIPRNETAQPRSQFLYLCICERLLYSHDWSLNAIQQNRRTDRANIQGASGIDARFVTQM
jgi:hypothetical protein